MKYLAIDVGGTFVKHALITDTGIQNGGREKTITKSLAEFEEQLLTIIQYYQKETVEGIGFSVPGKVDSKTGILYHGGALPFLHHYSLIKQISKK